MITIDLNSDVGEGINNEAQLLPFLSSCNIACGGHAGDAETMEKVVHLAIKHNVKIGAHPSYEDRTNFGRVVLDISRKQLKKSITQQILRLKRITERQGQPLHHIKPHGALYNKAATDKATASTIIEAILEVDKDLTVYVPFQSVIQKLATGVLPLKVEGFADRNYNSDYTLVSRSHKNALITEPIKVLRHMSAMIGQKTLVTVDQNKLPIKLETLCVHGDTPQAIEILAYIHKHAASHQIQIA